MRAKTGDYIIRGVNGEIYPCKPDIFEKTYECVAKSYGDIYNEFCEKFPLAEVQDYRPAVEMHIPQLSEGIPNAIIVWLKDGSKVIYIAESEDKE